MVETKSTEQSSRAPGLWLCLRFSLLSLNCCHAQSNSPSVIGITQRQQIWQLTKLAYEAGIRRGQSVSHAMMLVPDIQLLERDAYKEHQRLETLSNWAYRYTSHVHVYDDHTLLLEIGRSLDLFKGLKHLMHLIVNDLDNANIDCEIGLAHTPKAAYLLSFHDELRDVDSIDPLAFKHYLANARLQHLAVNAKIISKLRHCGFTTLGDIQTIANTELGERFGVEFVDYLDRLYGRTPDPQLFKVPNEAFKSRVDFAEPISNRTWIEQQLERLLNDLVTFLTSRNLLCRVFSWNFYNEKNHLLHTINVSLASLKTDFATLKELTDLQLEKTIMQWHFSSIELTSHSLQQRGSANIDLFNPQTQQEDINQLVEKLMNRLGEDALFKVEAVPEHLPELACQINKLSRSMPSNTVIFEPDTGLEDEPLWLLEKPKRLVQQGGRPKYQGDLTFIHGPHRITSHWWIRLQSRDYYIARQRSGGLIWVYFERSEREWFLHGVFA